MATADFTAETAWESQVLRGKVLQDKLICTVVQLGKHIMCILDWNFGEPYDCMHMFENKESVGQKV